jgi:hypothetical protein
MKGCYAMLRFVEAVPLLFLGLAWMSWWTGTPAPAEGSCPSKGTSVDSARKDCDEAIFH